MDIRKNFTYFYGLLAVLLLAPVFVWAVEVKAGNAVRPNTPRVVAGAATTGVTSTSASTAKPASQKTVSAPSSAATQMGGSAAKDSSSARGRAKELRPDISVPPSADEGLQAAPAPGLDKESFEKMITGLEKVAAVASSGDTQKTGSNSGLENLPVQAHRSANAAKKVRWAPPPPGFLTAETFNYLIYREEHPVTPTIRTTLDTIHGNLMLDLTPFTILIKPNKILVMIFGGKDAYSSFTKLPPWSGAASDLQADTMYVVEGKSFYPLSVHELTHLYFDGYFLPTISPLWLSEGMAVYMQIHTTKQKPGWVDRSLKRIAKGDIIPLDTMTLTEDLGAYSTAEAELWYTQAYSLVDYLLTKRSRDEFYKFCSEIKAKTPLHQALYRAYGLPFTKVSVLENVWLHDLQKAYKEGRALSSAPVAQAVAPGTAADKQAPRAAAKPPTAAAPKPAAKPQPQKTQIKKLAIVPGGYLGGL